MTDNEIDDNEFFAEFDRYCEDNSITQIESPMAFAAWLSIKSGVDVEMKEITPVKEIAGVKFPEMEKFFSYLDSITEEGKENG